MLVISKKRIQIVLSCIIVGLLAFSFQIANNKEELKHNNQNSIQTTSTPVSGKTIVIDARTWNSR